MTQPEFETMLGTLASAGISIVKFRGLDSVLPRMIWQPGRIEPVYGSDTADEKETTVVAEYITDDGDDPNVDTIIQTFIENRFQFVCEIGYDQEKDEISYLFNGRLSEVI